MSFRLQEVQDVANESTIPYQPTFYNVANWHSYLQYLREEAAKWNLDIHAKFNGKEIECTIHLKQGDFSPYLTKRMIELFLKTGVCR